MSKQKGIDLVTDKTASNKQYLQTLIKLWRLEIGGFKALFSANEKTAAMTLVIRDKIEDLGGGSDLRVQKLDLKFFKFLIKNKPAYDNLEKPLEMWWWHQGSINKKSFLAELLPSHLKSVYLDYLNKGKK